VATVVGLGVLLPLIAFLKPQPWTNYKYKMDGTEGKGFYVDGGFEGNVADVTYAMAISRDHLGEDYIEARETFRKCVPAYFATLKTPRYPFIATVDAAQAEAGFAIFKETCARCHGTFEKTAEKQYALTSYPNLLVDHDKLGTDPLRIGGFWDFSADEKKKFLGGKVTTTHRYAAPPLLGIWARGPYLHNASVPTVYHLLKSSAKSHKEILQEIAEDEYVRIFDPDWRTPEQWELLRQALAD